MIKIIVEGKKILYEFQHDVRNKEEEGLEDLRIIWKWSACPHMPEKSV